MNPEWDEQRVGAPLKPVYGPEDLAGLSHLGGMPGEAPFVRGPYPSMYRHARGRYGSMQGTATPRRRTWRIGNP